MGNLFIFRGTLNLPGQAASEFYWRGINRIYGRNPNDAEAEEAFRRSVELDPTAYFVHIQLGNLYLKSRSREKCVRAYSEALKYAPEDRAIRSALQNQIERVSRDDLAEVSPLRDPPYAGSTACGSMWTALMEVCLRCCRMLRPICAD